jgi:hypothetical protein
MCALTMWFDRRTTKLLLKMSRKSKGRTEEMKALHYLAYVIPG